LKDRDLYEHYVVKVENGSPQIENDKFVYELAIHEPTTNGQDVLAFMVKNSKRLYYNLDIINEVSPYGTDLWNNRITPREYAKELYDKSRMIIME